MGIRASFVAVLLVLTAGVAAYTPARADDEAGNVAHVVAGPHGRCYVKSVPMHIYDPEDTPRQQGMTHLYEVGDKTDVLVHSYDWFSQQIFLLCGPGGLSGAQTTLVRLGPWHRGHDPAPGHLALAFYRGGKLLKRYSTLEIAGGETRENAFPAYKNVSASVSHYTVFETGPEMVRRVTQEGGIFSEEWRVQATTVDGRVLVFDIETGALR